MVRLDVTAGWLCARSNHEIEQQADNEYTIFAAYQARLKVSSTQHRLFLQHLCHSPCTHPRRSPHSLALATSGCPCSDLLPCMRGVGCPVQEQGLCVSRLPQAWLNWLPLQQRSPLKGCCYRRMPGHRMRPAWRTPALRCGAAAARPAHAGRTVPAGQGDTQMKVHLLHGAVIGGPGRRVCVRS